ncbi:MAG TPA: recombination protein RecR [Candidatus Fimimonas gallinarum]|uniref:Recombination protein RecR n=1 Tax=Candidatus Fimimonas gallinarum TaxID=2840821 RepID=A0A9D1J774_9BACT|nr:recombination protein RecR [Candidatus Fimimonas gallinarum]
MAGYIEPIEKLIRQFTKLPGVGAKTAQRYALTVLSMTEEEAKAFAAAVVEAKTNVKVCSVCGNYTDEDPCHICKTRDGSVICVVQEAKDVLAIERLGEYRGVYHVLGGVLNPLRGVGRDDIRLAQLFQRLTGDVKEVILATDTSAEGEATATYIARYVKQYGVKVTRLAQGISVGSELQYADEVTLSRAFSNRKEV